MAQVGDKRPNPSTDGADPTGVGLGEQENVTKRPRVEVEPWSDMSWEDIPEVPVYQWQGRSPSSQWPVEDLYKTWIGTTYGEFLVWDWEPNPPMPDPLDPGLRLVEEYRPSLAPVRVAVEKQAREKREFARKSTTTTQAIPATTGSPGPSRAAEFPKAADHSGPVGIDDVYRALVEVMSQMSRMSQACQDTTTHTNCCSAKPPSSEHPPLTTETAANHLSSLPQTTSQQQHQAAKYDLLAGCTTSLHRLSTGVRDLVHDSIRCTEERKVLRETLAAVCKEKDSLKTAFQREAFMREEAKQHLVALLEGLRFGTKRSRERCKLLMWPQASWPELEIRRELLTEKWWEEESAFEDDEST